MKAVQRMVFKVAIAVLAAWAIAGCGKDEKSQDAEYRPSLTNPDASHPPAVGPAMSIAQMKKDDVIVWVDGAALTAADFSDQVNFILLQLRQTMKKEDPKKVQRVYVTLCRRIPEDFVNDQLLVQEARRLKLVSADDLDDTYEEAKGNLASALNISPWEKLAKMFPNGQQALGRIAEEGLWKRKMMETIAPLATVDAPAVSNVIDQIKAVNAGISGSNEVNRTKLRKLRAEILRTNADFNEIAKQVSKCKFRDDEAKGNWGAFGRDEFKPEYDNGDMGEAIFKLKVGEISDVLEDGEGYSLVKFVEFDERDAKKPEAKRDRILSRIFLPKEPLYIIEPFPILERNLKEQMKGQAIEKKVAELKAKAKVVYPHGTEKLFDAPPSYSQLTSKEAAQADARKAQILEAVPPAPKEAKNIIPQPKKKIGERIKIEDPKVLKKFLAEQKAKKEAAKKAGKSKKDASKK